MSLWPSEVDVACKALEELSFEELARVRHAMARLGRIPGSNLVTTETEELLQVVDSVVGTKRKNLRATQGLYWNDGDVKLAHLFENPGIQPPHPMCSCITVVV